MTYNYNYVAYPFSTRVITAAGAITQVATDTIIVVNKTVPAATAIALIASPLTGQKITIKDGAGNSATYPLTITPNAGTIDGAATVVLATNYESIDLVYNGTSWSIC